MSPAGLWTRIGATWATAAALLAFAHPAPLRTPWPPLAAAPAGLAAGIALFLVTGGRLRRYRMPRVAAAAVLASTAGAEEAIWRWFALGELAARIGLPAALAASSALFALAHRDRFAGRFAAGVVFGGVYALSGSLAGACCAHAAHNLCVAAASRPVARSAEAAT